ncbi:MAG: SPOR domain-containing protein [Gammaproteobacteria bacterium]
MRIDRLRLAAAGAALLIGMAGLAQGENTSTGELDDRVSAGTAAEPGTDAVLAELARAAASGDSGAARTLATVYYNGVGTAADPARAIAWWRRAAAGGDAVAAYNAGLLLIRDPARAAAGRRLLEQAADSGDVLAAFVLGTHLARHGDHAAGRRWLEHAAQQGYAPAQFNLGRLLADTVPAEHAAARRWFAAAAPTFAPAATALADLPPAGPPASDTLTPAATQARSSGATTAPHDRAWVMAQPATAFTIQVGAGQDRGALARLVEHHAADYDSALFLHRPASREPYSAIVGVFSTPDSAAAALTTLPAALQSNAPWVRSFGALQRELASLKNDADGPQPLP